MEFGSIALLLIVILGFLFRGAIAPDRTVFSNDGPLGAISAQWADLPGGFLSIWQDLNWVGGAGPTGVPTITLGFAYLFGKLAFSKAIAPFALFLVGLGAWFCFRQMKLAPVACFVGGLAAALNMDFLSAACWGVVAVAISFGLNYFALAALSDLSGPRRWLRLILAGFAVGMGVMEAYDTGAIFSLAIAAYVIFEAFVGGTTAPRAKIGKGFVRLAIVGGCAILIATQTLTTLVGTQIKGIAGTAQDQETKQEHWDWATQWSMPKREVLTMVVPGLFGYRMDTPMSLPESMREGYNGGVYWGIVGRDPNWEAYYAGGEQGQRPRGSLRFTGGSQYAGVGVVLIALWAVFQSFRKEKSVFTAHQRKQLWFWGILIVVCALLSFGRFAPFYWFFYQLPFVSTVRLPGKFFHIVQWATMILFAYGVHGLSRSCLENPGAAVRGLADQLKAWWGSASAFDRKWSRGSLVLMGAGLLTWLIYASSRERLVAYLLKVDFDAAMADAIAGFSIRQMGWFVLFLALSLGLLALILSGYFNGRRARVAGILLGLLVVVDLGRADIPWVITYNWEKKLATNPVIDLLRQQPYEHRVAMLPFQAPAQLATLDAVYRIEWAQHQFPYYNVQSLDIVQMSRPPVDYVAFESALRFDNTSNTLYRITRRWELTNTRYLLGATGFLPMLNQQLDAGHGRFRVVSTFDIVPKPGITNPSQYEDLTAVTNAQGQFALFEFTGALPRAKLYSHWQVSTNDAATLNTLSSREFDPAATVLVDSPLPASTPAPTGTNADPGTVTFAGYAPKDIVLNAHSTGASVLLLNDRYDPNWQVFVDGRAQPLLRCNYLMRGVVLDKGDHKVEFKYLPPVTTFYVSLAAVGLAVCLCLFMACTCKSAPPAEPAAEK